jgi:hypothetical protein
MIWRYGQSKYSYFLESDINIIPITKEANPPGMNLTVNILVKSIIMPIIHNITPNLNFHLFCIVLDISFK